ncbi:hypothetical protein GTW71_19885, partial [Streptomyces sp. SID6041]|nr:hypothetical protein [Streptomyces sp. SID6041]
MAEHGDEEHVLRVGEVHADAPTVAVSGHTDEKPHGLAECVVLGVDDPQARTVSVTLSTAWAEPQGYPVRAQ